MSTLELIDKPIIMRDYETSGLNPLFDQILTSSAKRFANGKIVDEIYLSCRCESSRLPSPYALMVNGHTKHDLENGMPLKELMDSDLKFNEKYPSDFILTYNAKFDFNFSFHGYYQQLVTPSWYSWKTQNKLICGLEMIKSIYAFKKRIKYLNIPLNLFSSPSFRLERVCADNGIRYAAHNSSEDVNATYGLLEIMKSESPEIVTQAMRCSSKQFVKNIINFNSFFCTSIGTGEDLFARALVPIAWSAQGNDVICIDIAAVNPKEISKVSSWEIYLQTLQTKIDHWIVKVPINKGKIFFGEEALSSCYNPSNCNIEQLKHRAEVLKANTEFISACKGAFTFFDELYADQSFNDSLEKSIFQNFAQVDESNFIYDFNNLPWSERWQFINDNQHLERGNRIVKLAKKLVLEYDIDAAPENIQRSYIRYCNERLFDINSKKTLPWNGISSVINEIAILKRDRPGEIARIKEIEDYFDGRLAAKFV